MADAAKTNVNTRMPKGARRPKASRACLACRKLKARCEPAAGARPILAEDPQSSSLAPLICHRCKTLCIDCLYESDSGQIVNSRDLPLSQSAPSPTAEHDTTLRSAKRSRPGDDNAPTSDPFTNDRALFLSPAISPSLLTRSIYRDVAICSLQTTSSASLERPVLIANAFSRLIGAAPALKPDAQQYLLGTSGAFAQGATSSHDWNQAPAALCAGKAAARLMSRRAPPAPYPENEVIFLSRQLQPHEQSLRILFQGLYGAFSPFLSTPFEDSLDLATCQSEAQCFLLLTIYLVALPHLISGSSLVPVSKPLRKAVDALLRRALHSPSNDHLNIFALHNCASFLLLPVDGMAEAHRPLSTSEQQDDGLLEFAIDLNPRAAIITALVVAHRLGYASLASKLPTVRHSIEAISPANGHGDDPSLDQYAHAVLCTFTWLTLLQFRASIDVAEERIEWNSLAQFETDIPRVRIEDLTASLLPPPSFLSPREQSRCCWMAQRAELYAIARDLRHTKRASASFSKKEAEDQASAYRKAIDGWRYKFNEQMRSMSIQFGKDPRGLGLHRYFFIFANAEAQSLLVTIGSVYHKEFISDMRQRLEEPFYQDNMPWKSAATALLGHETDRITKAVLINFSFTDAMLKAMGHISTLAPVMPQLYDFVSYEETLGSEIPSLCIAAPPNIQAGLFAVPLLAAADLRLSVIETWGASAAYFNPHLLPLLTNCVKSLRACHVNVASPGVLKMPFTTANPIADYLQGPFEILMRKVAAAEERLQISHVESIVTDAFLLSKKKKEIESIAEELAPEAPEMVQAIADSQKIEDEISASMRGSLHVQDIQEIEEKDTDYAVKVFGLDLREADLKATRRPGRSAGSPAVTSDADGSRRANSNVRSVSADLEQGVDMYGGPLSASKHRVARSVFDASRFSSPGQHTQPLQTLHPEAPSDLPTEAMQAQNGLRAQGVGTMYPSAAAARDSRPTSSALHPQPPSTFASSMPQADRPRTTQADALFSTTLADRGAPGAAPLRGYTHDQALDERSGHFEHFPQSMASAYTSYPAADEHLHAGGVVGNHASDQHIAARVVASDEVFAYPACADVPQTSATPGFGPAYRRPSGIRMGGVALEASGTPRAAWPASATGINVSQPWGPSTQQPQPEYEHGHPPHSVLRGLDGSTKYEPCTEVAAPRQADSQMGHPYYLAQQHPSQHGYQHAAQYSMQHPGDDPAYSSQQEPHVHPSQHQGRSAGLDAHYPPAIQPHQGESQGQGQPPSNAEWQVWNWSPAQHQHHQYQQQ